MKDNISYTTEEIAKLLKISKLTVYDLIKKGKLPAYKVGKQMRIDHADLEAYKQASKDFVAKPAHDTGKRELHVASQNSGVRQVVITGQDLSLDILASHLEKRSPFLRPLRSYVGSLDSLISMYQGKSDIVSTHLLDGDTGEYNVPYIRKLLVGSSYLVVNLMSRWAGLYVAPGNPHQLQGWPDLTKPGLRFVNREKGAGARVLVDEQLRIHGLDRRLIQGYEYEETSHFAVAAKVASGEADVGVGSMKAASVVAGVEFIPLIKERYDLVLLDLPENTVLIQAVLDILRSDTFRHELNMISGYDLSETGKIMLRM
ncbi:substrate-binding domain-containing protein [Paenibacillus gallinarum]|uniref:Helix-turn-helix transcriptional regulator n=1 Tax=Paenibacillus gallinarum TaxID=2762232 RepID=A0ABR8SWK7_9BACL|nr:helix-turn-helix transcriptional regulator [Paenibacillus gallinarum]MBD7967881.1 helix-turn-helix transcriptional regulator [Paenibacillus gallinarum]